MEEMKLKVGEDYYRKVRKVLESGLNGGNTVTAINMCVVAAERYTAGIVN